MTTTPSFLTNHDEIRAWLALYCKRSGAITISAAGVVSVAGDAVFTRLAHEELTHFAVKFAEVTGNFDCRSCAKLRSLEGSPPRCGNFICNYCPELTTLTGAPAYVDRDF